MNYGKTILCFADSRKLTGRCIVGKELANNQLGDWVRPVSGTVL
ncbi:dual OB domain-containing protein [Burkholderia gladioli]